ncbi:MAG: divalent-cation tolerance protein CutA [Bryobacteraceae bacterium]|nr:MAG: divalent-cation tolerance protein CutA [Bryobacteraceae bacterium]
MTDKIIVLTTCPSEEEAGRIARLLVEERLAACVQILPPMRSIYRWRGALEESEERLLVIKTRRGLFGDLSRRVRASHSYEVPELLAVPVVDGAEDYLAWMDAELRQEGSLQDPSAV